MIDASIIGRHGGLSDALLDSTLDKVQPISVASQVAANLREAILAGRFEPGKG